MWSSAILPRAARVPSVKTLPSPSERLLVEDHVDATVMPVRPFPQPRRPFAMKMGVFDRRGRVVRQSLLWRSYGRMGFPAEPTSPPRKDVREVVFGGHLPRHFGHFILEGLSRLWFARQHPALPIAWACPAGEPAPSYTSWQQQILEVVGIGNEALFVTEPTRFARVHVPEAGYRVKDFCSDQQAAFLAAYPARPRDPELRLWLSRSAVGSAFESVHAARLERQLAALGWTIVQPERLPIREQLELLARSIQVAGEEGSAFHLLALLADLNGLRVDIICRRPDRPVEHQNHNYQTIADSRSLQQRLHVVPEERVLGVEGGHVRKVATTLAGHLEAVGVVWPPPSAMLPGARPQTGARPLAGLANVVAAALGAGSYLEVGDEREGVYPNVTIPVRDIVRTRFQVDPRRSQGDGLQLFEMPCHEFFLFCADLSRRYDVIVLDGFATRGQLLQRLIGSRRHAHPGTVWLLHATDDADTGSGLDLVRDLFPWLRWHRVVCGEGTCLVLAGEAASGEWLDTLGLAPAQTADAG